MVEHRESHEFMSAAFSPHGPLEAERCKSGLTAASLDRCKAIIVAPDTNCTVAHISDRRTAHSSLLMHQTDGRAATELRETIAA